MKPIPLSTSLPLYYVGPDLSADPSPYLLYFALSAEESLTINPFCQPVSYFHTQQIPLRIVSVDLPFHGKGLPATEGMTRWAEAYKQGDDILTDFLLQLETSLRQFFHAFPPTHVGAMGLSRGGFIASHLAAKLFEISSLMLFAPLTQLHATQEFSPLPPIPSLTLSSLTPILSQKKIRIHMGNRDVRVSTDACYAWVRSLVEEAFSAHNLRSPQIEFCLRPSIGFAGHGTSQESFEEGAAWMARQLIHEGHA